MSDYKIQVPGDNFDFTKLSLVNPITLQGGTFFTKLLNDHNELYIQTPICSTKNGFVKTAKKISTDLIFEKSNSVFIEWIENLEVNCISMIHERSKDWFQDEVELDDIESAFTSSIRSYKSGSYHLIKTTTESPRMGNTHNLSIYDQQEKQLKIEDVPIDSNMICVLQIHGVKFTSKSFQIFIQLKQVMILNDNMFNRCQIRPNVEVRSKRKISLKATEIDENNEEEVENNIVLDDVSSGEKENNIEQLDITSNDEELVESKNTEEKEKNLEEVNNLEELTEPTENIEEITLDCDTNNLETITLKKPDEVYLEIYEEARKKAKEAKKQALMTYLELQKLESEYGVEGLDDSDDEVDKAIKNGTKNIEISETISEN